MRSVAKVMSVAADWPAGWCELPDAAAVTMGEPSCRLHDSCSAAREREDARIMLMISQQLLSLTGVCGDGGARVLHLRAGVWR